MILGFIAAVAIGPIVGFTLDHNEACNTARNTISAVNGHIVFWQYSKSGDNWYIARNFVWHPDNILGINREDDGIDINVRGMPNDINIYGMTPEEFTRVWDEAKKQMKEWNEKNSAEKK